MAIRDRAAYAGLLAASSAVVSKHARHREPLPMSLPRSLRPAGLEDLPALLDPSNADVETTTARLTAASLLYAVEEPDLNPVPPAMPVLGGIPRQRPRQRQQLGAPKSGGHARRLLTPEEGRLCDAYAAELPDCRYCRMFFDLFYRKDPPDRNYPVEVVNHNARIESDFDPDTGVASARMDKYEVLVPEARAIRMLKRGHPLFWKEAAPDLFEKALPAKTVGAKPNRSWEPDSGKTPGDWERGARNGTEYLYEVATWPWNETVSSEVENVLRIEHFTNQPANGWNRRLEYDYALESCIQGSFGIGWEYGGLDIDDGFYSGKAKPYSAIAVGDVEHLQQSDLVHLKQTLELRMRAMPNDYVGWCLNQLARIIEAWRPERALELNHAAVWVAGEALSTYWGEEAWLVELGASKRLRYTVPRHGPADLWSALTWMAPAMLFVFINRAVAQAAHFP